MWTQKTIQITKKSRGFHLVTREIVESLPELQNYRVGILHLFLKHTSASISLNENFDPTVRADMEDSFNRIVPQDLPYRHDMEGPDDMPAHVKSTLIGASLSIPITNGQLNMGTWQGIYLCEHRDRAGSRKIVCTIQGATN
eukprot:TRINITY_DN4373_c0_g1_i1.p1 TRINITY_DN4373_c0_g1~~TRINITY_DN4373_c0_g1_i1.p1  ORF type:complete len:141 (-),score=26.56 TRINITY_DN4373_c0_g1_i1:58-480(-)